MVRIADLIENAKIDVLPDDFIELSGDTTASEALTKMQESGCQYVAVDCVDCEKAAVLSKDQVLQSLVDELANAQIKLDKLHQQIDVQLTERLDSVAEGVQQLGDDHKSKLELAFATISEGLIILGLDFEIENANPATKKILGLNSGDGLEVIASAMNSLGLFNTINSEIQHNNHHAEFTVKSPDGKTLSIRWTKMTEKRGAAGPQGSVMIIRDISAESVAEKAKDGFLSAVSHELRTPLTSIQSSVSNILAGVTGRIGRKTRQYLQTVHDECIRETYAINELLDVSRLESATMPVQRTIVRITEQIESAIDYFYPSAKVAKVKLFSEIVGFCQPMYIDPERFSEALHHLISNAIINTPQGGKVIVRAKDCQDEIIIEVQDNGKGIPEHMQEHIFDKFYQNQRQAGAGYNGFGLGLTIAMGIVELHGGRIWLQSQPGKGSTFSFSLPKTDPSVVLSKHLNELSQNPAIKSDPTGLLLLTCGGCDVNEEHIARLIINDILSNSDAFLRNKGELALRKGNLEAVFVLPNVTDRTIANITKKVREIVKNTQRKYCNGPSILPMMAVAGCPGDVMDIHALEDAVGKAVRQAL